MGGINRMADDRMKHEDAQRNMGTKGNQDFGQQSPGRSGQSGQQGGQKGAQNLEDDEEFDTGKSGGQNRGGQNR